MSRIFVGMSSTKLRSGVRKSAAPLKDFIGGRYTHGRITSITRSMVWDRDNGKCSHCHAAEDLQFDHIIPVALGGSGSPANVELLCRTCNLKKGKKLLLR